MKLFYQRHVAAAMVISLSVISVGAQQVPALSQRAQAVKTKVAQLSPGDKISVVRIQAEEEFGKFLSRTESDFTFHDVDQKQDITLKYEDVKKVKNGYSGPNIRGRHTDPTRHLVILVVGLAAIMGLAIGGAVASK